MPLIKFGTGCILITCIVLVMQRNGKHTLWEHLRYLQTYTQAESGLFIGTRLTHEHINLTSYSKMKVNLAAQVHYQSNCITKFNYTFTCNRF